MNLDHVGIVGRDLDALSNTFETFGFTLTPLARHAGGRTGNRCVMLRDGGYLELLSTIGGGTSATINRFLARHEGAHLLAIGVDDVAAARARLQRVWDAVPNIAQTDRAVDDADPNGPRARFALLGPFDRPEGRVHLIQHETRDALWQPRFLDHPNKAVALEEVILAVPDPAPTAAWYSVLTGRPVVPDPDGGYALPLQTGRIHILPSTSPSAPLLAAITIRTGDQTVIERSASNCEQFTLGQTVFRFR